MITIYDHNTHPLWVGLYKFRHESKNRTNGGYTYSQDIVKYHIPVIKDILSKQDLYNNIIISSVALLEPSMTPPETDLFICYLHENSIRELPRITGFLSWYKGDVIFITSRAELHKELKDRNIKSVLLPMSIDVSAIAKYAKSEKYADKRVLYFGNTYLGKGGSLSYVKQAFIKKGWIFDQISFNMFNGGHSLTRDQIFDIIAKYKYGIGEGRCVLEMNALGLRTLVCASSNQGIFTNDDDFALQRAHNFSDGTIWTFSPDINECIDNFDKAIVKTIDVQDVLPILKEQLERVLL
jgi:hypothetical protein